MNHHTVHKAALGLIPLLIFLLAGVAWAGSSANYDLNWQVICGGGAPSTVGDVSLVGSLGQTATGPAAGGDYGLGAGFWYGLGEVEYSLYLPLILKNY